MRSDLSRRTFLGQLGLAGTATVAMGAVGPLQAAMALSGSRPGIASVTAEDFECLVGTRFHLECEDARARMVLAQVVPLKTGGNPSELPSRRRAFAIRFRSSSGDHGLDQAIYRVRHARLGVMDLLLVPVGPRVLEAVFA